MSARNHINLIASLLALLVTPVLAYEPESRPFYGGLSFGYAVADQDCNYYNDDCDGEDTSFSVYAGKRLYKHLAFEIAYLDLGKLDNERYYETTTAETTGVNFSVLGILPIDYTGYIYGKAGYMAWNTDYTRKSSTKTTTSDSGTDFTYGLGIAFVHHNVFEFRMEIERLNELDENFDDGGAHIINFSIGGSIYIH